VAVDANAFGKDAEFNIKRLRAWAKDATEAGVELSVGTNQSGGGSRDGPDRRKLPRTHVFGVDQLNAIRPWSDVEAAGLTEVEEHSTGAPGANSAASHEALRALKRRLSDVVFRALIAHADTTGSAALEQAA